jgi:hypothetical protein
VEILYQLNSSLDHSRSGKGEGMLTLDPLVSDLSVRLYALEEIIDTQLG